MESKQSIIAFSIFAIIFSLILGTLLHFTFAWSDNNPIVGSFSAVNESVWEHLKLAFFPMLLTTIIGLFSLSNKPSCYLCSRAIGILVAISFITIFFYTYTGIIGTNYAFLDIGSFVIAILLGEFVSYKLMLSSSSPCPQILCIALLVSLVLGFTIFTYFPPKLNYFRDPVTNLYGSKKNN